MLRYKDFKNTKFLSRHSRFFLEIEILLNSRFSYRFSRFFKIFLDFFDSMTFKDFVESVVVKALDNFYISDTKLSRFYRFSIDSILLSGLQYFLTFLCSSRF